jgi:ABC-type spermidine/putrescine transport systems, ATPase components
MSKIISIEDLTLVLGGRTILDIPRLSLEEGDAISLMGPNGAGKSSLLMVMAALQEPTSGKLYYRGREYSEYSELSLHRKMAMVFQKPIVLDLSVMENAELGLKFRGVSRRVRLARIRPWLERLGVAHLEKSRARSLSGGEAQRVVLAQSLVLEPEVIFLDEPFSNLDKDIRQELMEQTGGLLKEHRITTVLVTHHSKEAQALSDTVYFMEDGRIVGFENMKEHCR